MKTWPSFIKLEKLRNSIVHLKTVDFLNHHHDKNYFYQLLKPNIFTVISSAQELVYSFFKDIGESTEVPVLNKSMIIKNFEFEDFELSEEYFNHKGIISTKNSENETIVVWENNSSTVIKHFSGITRIS